MCIRVPAVHGCSRYSGCCTSLCCTSPCSVPGCHSTLPLPPCLHVWTDSYRDMSGRSARTDAASGCMQRKESGAAVKRGGAADSQRSSGTSNDIVKRQWLRRGEAPSQRDPRRRYLLTYSERPERCGNVWEGVSALWIASVCSQRVSPPTGLPLNSRARCGYVWPDLRHMPLVLLTGSAAAKGLHACHSSHSGGGP